MVRGDGRGSGDGEECGLQARNDQEGNKTSILVMRHSEGTKMFFILVLSPFRINYEVKIKVKALQCRALHLHLNARVINLSVIALNNDMQNGHF